MNRLWVIITAIFMLTVGTAAAGARIYYKSDAAVSEIISTKKDIAEIDRKEANIKKLEDLLASVSDEQEKVSDVFTSAGNLVLFIENLEEAARSSGVLLNIESAEIAKDGSQTLPQFRLITEGGFGANFRYLELLERIPFQLEIGDLALALRPSEQNQTMWQTRVTLTLLSFVNERQKRE